MTIWENLEALKKWFSDEESWLQVVEEIEHEIALMEKDHDDKLYRAQGEAKVYKDLLSNIRYNIGITMKEEAVKRSKPF